MISSANGDGTAIPTAWSLLAGFGVDLGVAGEGYGEGARIGGAEIDHTSTARAGGFSGELGTPGEIQRAGIYKDFAADATTRG